MYEEDEAIFHIPVENVAPAVAPATVETPVSAISEAAKVVPTEKPAQIVDNFSHSDKLSDQALFDELNLVSEEVIKCRDRILSKIS